MEGFQKLGRHFSCLKKMYSFAKFAAETSPVRISFQFKIYLLFLWHDPKVLHLRGLIHLAEFSSMLKMEKSYMNSLLLSCTTRPIRKGIHSKRKELAPKRSNFPVSILYKSTAGRYRPVRVADGPITARCIFIKNASWVLAFSVHLFSEGSKLFKESRLF